MEKCAYATNNSALIDIQDKNRKQPIINGKIINISRNFGKLPLIDVLGKAVVRQLSQNKALGEP